MTQILFDLKETSPQGDVPIDAQINCYPVARRKDGTVLVTRRGFTERTGFKPVVIDLHHTGLDGAWLITISSHNNDIVHGFYAVPKPVMDGGKEIPIPFNDLIEVDPETLEPSENPDPIWWTMARSTVTGGNVDSAGDLILTHYDGKTANAGRVKGDKGDRGLKGEPGKDGANDPDVASYISDYESETSKALSIAINEALSPNGNDDTSSLNAQLASSAGKIFKLKAGEIYKVSGTLTVPDGTIFDGSYATIDASSMPIATGLSQKIAIKASGTREQSLVVSTPISRGSKVIQGVDTAGFTAGDHILISNDERPVPGLSRSDRDKGEIVLVHSVDSSTQLTLSAGVLFSYGTTGLRIAKINPVTVTIRNLTIICGGLASGHNGVFIENATNSLVEDVKVYGAEDVGITIRTTSSSSVRSCYVSGSTSSATLGNSGYGVNINDGSTNVIVSKNHFDDCRHWVAGGGVWPTTYIDVVGNHGKRARAAGYDCHESTFFWNFSGNTATGATGEGFIIRGQHITVNGNTVTDSPGGGIKCFSWDGVSEQVGLIVTGNRLVRSGNGIMVDGLSDGSSGDSIKRDLIVTGNDVRDVTYTGITVRHFAGATVSGNTVRGVATDDGIKLLGHSVGTPSTDLTAAGNKVFDISGGSSKTGIRITNVLRPTLDSSSVTESLGEAFTLTGCFDTVINGCHSHRANFAGLRIDGGARHAVNGGIYSNCTSSSGDGIRVTNSSDLSIIGTITANPRFGVYVTGTDNVVVTLNIARENGNATKINVDSLAVNKIVQNNL